MGDNYQGVTSNNIAQYILPLRKILAKYRPDKTFIGTSPKRGYIFEAEVLIEDEAVKNGGLQNLEISGFDEYQPLPLPLTNTALVQETVPVRKNYLPKLLIALSALLLIVVVAVAATSYFSVTDEEQVRNVVKDSQMYESLVLYKEPFVI